MQIRWVLTKYQIQKAPQDYFFIKIPRLDFTPHNTTKLFGTIHWSEMIHWYFSVSKKGTSINLPDIANIIPSKYLDSK